MKKKWLSILLRVAISVGLIAYFLSSLAKDEGGLGGAMSRFAWAFRSTSWRWLLIALMLHPIGFSLAGLRWKILLAAQGARVSFIRLFLSYIMATFFNTFLPGTVGGDALRIYHSTKLTGKGAQSLVVVIIERLTGVMALLVIAGTAFFLYISTEIEQRHVLWLFLGLGIGAFALLIIAAHPRIAHPLLRLAERILPARLAEFTENSYSAVEVYYHHPIALVAAQGVSIVFQLNMVFYYFLIAKALHQDPSPVDFMMKIPVMEFLLLVVPTINGIGVRTASFRELMKFPKEFALAGEMVDLGMKIGYGLLGGLIFLFYRQAQSAQGPQGAAKEAQ